MTSLPYQDPQRPAAERAADLLARMTLPEKIAQMHALWFSPAEDGRHLPRAGDSAAAPELGGQVPGNFQDRMRHGLGQIARPLGTRAVAPREGLRALNALQRWLRHETRLGIPAISHEECLLGLMAQGGTLFPSPLAYGATWNPALIEQVGEQIGLEARAVGCHQGLAPVLDVSRDVRWGRTDETFGECPYLTGVMATRYVRGLQGPQRDLLATLKHFVAHSAGEGGRNHAPVHMGWRELNDSFLLPFEMAVKQADAGSVMPAYHDIDGEPCHASPQLLTRVLREAWGFDGLVVADYAGIALLHRHHGVATDAAHAAALAFSAGLDIELPDDECASRLSEAVERGLIPLAKIDEIVKRVLVEKFRLGLFERSFDDDSGAERLAQPAAAAVALEVARQSVVLLHNDAGLVPLDPAVKPRLAVIGPTADDPLAHLGGYSFPVHLILQNAAAGAGRVRTPLQALRDVFGAAQLRHARGCTLLDERCTAPVVFPGDVKGEPARLALSTDRSGIADAVAAARASDVALVFIGDLPGLFMTGTIGEGSDTDSLALPGLQQELLQAVVDTGVPTVAVLSSGRPYHLGGLEGRLAALLMTFSGGEAAGAAIAEVLAGITAPSGRLTISAPQNIGAVPCHYDHRLKSPGTPVAAHFAPRYAFGHGLSTTRFDYGALQMEATDVPLDGEIVLRFELANTGPRAGVDVPQLYVRDRVASVVQPVRALKGFTRVVLDAGQTANVEFRVPVDLLHLTGLDGHRQVEPGEFDVFIGPSSACTPLQARITVTGSAPRRLPVRWRMESSARWTISA